ncbi:hypothetical protein AWH62_06020 [Maricaulis sp. W15]|uniref:Uncharacterized protein n=1 Tax=Maricaulis maris TaxID=74318 RepID=A0A495D427_9PROT|nr:MULTISPECIES: hypothetical protein [Maricaulis]OLF75377.1 hypothetical protein AWH62_06020 [Maricaulis sp. W15]RKQ96665.1 hypothetical protein C7435_1998 [Maricaulis maris]
MISVITSALAPLVTVMPQHDLPVTALLNGHHECRASYQLRPNERGDTLLPRYIHVTCESDFEMDRVRPDLREQAGELLINEAEGAARLSIARWRHRLEDDQDECFHVTLRFPNPSNTPAWAEEPNLLPCGRLIIDE